MYKKGFVFYLVLVLLGLTLITCTTKRDVESERLIVKIDFSSWISESFTISPDGRRVAYWAKKDNKLSVVVDGEEGKLYDRVSVLIFSPDGKRVAYGAGMGDKWMVVVDGAEGKLYDGIRRGGPIFSPDGKRVAYGARIGDKWMVVVDGAEGKLYWGFFTDIFFDSPASFHYLADRGNNEVYLVEGRVE